MKPKPTTVTITFQPGDIPKGFRLTGEYRRPLQGEWYLWHDGTPWLSEEDSEAHSYLILIPLVGHLPQKKRGRGKG